MILSLNDLDELFEKVRNSTSKFYIKEAILSYKSGAYRAAIISTWIAVCTDIIEKIKELALSGDSYAKLEEEKIKKIHVTDINGMLQYERNILEVASEKLELISHIEKIQLERLKEDRNICAHPLFSKDGYQFNPTPEATRTHITHSILFLLQNIPIRGKFIIERIMELILEPSFPIDEHKAFTLLSSDQYLGKTKESNLRNLVIIILKRILLTRDRITSDMFFKFNSSLSAIERINLTEFSRTIKDKLNEILAKSSNNELRRILILISLKPSLLKNIDESNRVRIESLISNLTVKEIRIYRILHIQIEDKELNKTIVEKIDSLDDTELEELTNTVTSPFLLQYIIKQYIESSSFSEAYRIGSTLILPHADFFDSKTLNDTLMGIKNCTRYTINQILNANGTDEVLSDLFKKTKNQISDYKSIWLTFWNGISSYQKHFPSLQSELIENEIINEPKPSIVEDEFETPF